MMQRRLPAMFSVMLLLGAGCTGDDPPLPSGPDQSSVCCECACASDGVPCLNITIEGTEGDNCPEMCESECAAHDECPTVGAIATCNVIPPDDPGSVSGPGCSEAQDDELDNCQDPGNQQL